MTKWDCIHLDALCFNCEYFHRLVESEKKPECPRGLDPQWRRIG